MAELRDSARASRSTGRCRRSSCTRLIQEIAQPELPGPERSYKFKVEQWDRTEDHIIWLIAVSNNLLVARGAYEAAVKYNPRERSLLRDSIRVVEWYEPLSSPPGSREP